MLFNSLSFLIFLPVVLVVHHFLSTRRQNLWLLIASYYFYGSWDWRFLSLILVSTAVDYVVGLYLGTTDEPRRRKALVTVSLLVNLGILGFFKYFNFFADSAAALLAGLGFEVHPSTLNVVLPVGISFYTFQTLSYSIDVYRRKIEPTRDLLTFALFVAYFPQLVAGPIERASNLLPSLSAPRRVTWPAMAVGVELMLFGYLKKVALADTLAPIVDLRFQNPGLSSGPELLLTAYLFSFQIYGDFSGYSDIARGASKLLGIDLMRNFNQPYLSKNVTEFWRRWHISLSTWLRDYLYISLGGSRRGVWLTYRNLLVTMLLGGLWHGANWTFVVWGGVHGLYLSVHKFWLSRKTPERGPPQFSLSRQILSTFLTFNLVTFTWIFFRSDSFTSAWQFVRGIALWQSNAGAFAELTWFSPKIIFLVASVGMVDLEQNYTGHHAFVVRWHWAVRGVGYALLLIVLLAMGNLYGDVPFIYFQF